MSDGGRLEVQDEVESDKASDGRELMSKCLTREEMEQAQGSLKKKALGSDGLTAVYCNVLVNLPGQHHRLVLEVWEDSL